MIFPRYVLMIAVILLPASGLSASDDKKTDTEKLQGEWALVKAVIEDKEWDADKIKGRPLVIKGAKWTPALMGPTMTITIDATKNPKHLDLQMGKNKRFIYRGIFKLEGDTLTFCRPPGFAGERPTEFKAGKGVTFLQFKRLGK